ncbi:MAG TPA: DUF294 nucleotidyltransferase-like domain-containing protein [Pseudorhodoplanes sp.]|nr:DUF294 nucleotidyltransferase-like domain-containing protein [Pseudorhodoplanes sp.]
MSAMANVTPLIALDAVVIDTETTGLDPRRARIVEIAAVRLAQGRIGSDRYRSLVRPGEPIPKSSTEIHHIDDSQVAGAPSFAELWPELRAQLGEAVVIGHNIGFDIAVLQKECARIGEALAPRAVLDTRLLAQLVARDLAGYTIESLSAWLGVEAEGRHSALGDAVTAARIFVALVPRLRERGIRTLAEAAAACRALTDVLDEQRDTGWADIAGLPDRPGAERRFRRIDDYPYRHRVGDVMRSPALFVTADTVLGEVLARMMRERVSSLYILPASGGPARPRAAETGIVTERDVLRAIATEGAAALDRPASRFMSLPLDGIRADAFVYRAIGRMARLKVRHLAVVDDFGAVVGALSARDVLRLRAGEAVSLGDEIEEAPDVHALAAAWAKLARVATALRAEEVPARDIAAIVSQELAALTRQAAILSERRMDEKGRGAPPCAYALAVLGSAGRGESLLAMDQDNAIVFAQGEPGGAEDAWFAALGAHVADILHEAGVPYCAGGVMARNAPWRGSAGTWRKRIDGWIAHARPEDLLSVDIFFDLRCVHGDASLADGVWRYAFEAAKDQAGFAKLLAEASGEPSPGLGLFGRILTENGRIDLKRAGLFAVVSLARLLAIRHHVVERSTEARLAGLARLGIGGAADLVALDSAHATFLDLVLGQQIEDIARGRPPSNKVALKALGARARENLREALEAVRAVPDLKRDLLFRT